MNWKFGYLFFASQEVVAIDDIVGTTIRKGDKRRIVDILICSSCRKVYLNVGEHRHLTIPCYCECGSQISYYSEIEWVEAIYFEPANVNLDILKTTPPSGLN